MCIETECVCVLLLIVLVRTQNLFNCVPYVNIHAHTRTHSLVHTYCVHKAHKLHIKLQLDYVQSVFFCLPPHSILISF